MQHKSNQTVTVFFAINRHTNKATILDFYCWELVQGAFRVGIVLPDGSAATGIGRCKSLAEFQKLARHGKTEILSPRVPSRSLAPVTPSRMTTEGLTDAGSISRQ